VGIELIKIEQLNQLMPAAPSATLASVIEPLNNTCAEFSINTPQRITAFLAQLAHESGELRWMNEIWGPTEAQHRYEPPSKLAARLGNTQPGDGKRYRGRGPIQLTGRANYKIAGVALALPLEDNPDLVATPAVGIRVAGWFWNSKDLNTLADQNNYLGITRRINGGTNGLADRVKYWERAKTIWKDEVKADSMDKPK
jgi:predicted chitinase